MTSLANFAALAKGKSVVERHTDFLPDTNSPGVRLSRLFTYQSYFDDTLLEKALLMQSANEPIVGSTKKSEGIAGYSFGLHPSSQTPVAIQPLVGGSPAGNQAIILTPGQTWRPTGRPGNKNGNFSGFVWGLPFGWLGGGLATLYVFPSPDAKVLWPSARPEILFHRQRMQIGGFTLPTNAPKNWPLRFPWTQALRGAISQAGQASIGLESTQVLMSLRLAALTPAVGNMRMLFQSTNDFGLDSTGAIIATDTRFIDYIWGTYVAQGGAGNLSGAFPVLQLTGEAARLAADDGGLALVDLDATAQAGGPITNAFVDFTRYGRC